VRVLTIPNSADAAFAGQADPDKVDVDILVAGIGGTGVLSGCEVTAQAVPDMTVAVAAGSVAVGATRVAVAAGNVAVAADPANPRFTLIVVSSAGVKSAVAGVAAATPAFPGIPASSVVLAAVYIPAADAAIASNQIVDKRVLLSTDLVVHVRDEKASGTDGGTFTSGAWQTRTLNTVKTNDIAGASLAANELTLPAGTYEVEAYAPAHDVTRHQARLYNVTGAAELALGSNENADPGDAVQSTSRVRGRFTLAGTSNVRLEHRCSSTNSGNGFGFSVSWGTCVYAEVIIRKIG
jgi:hypothetical protein